MDKPSANWQKIRLATLDRARRTTTEPFAPLYTIYAGVCVCYLVGFIRFQFFDTAKDLNWITALQLFFVGISGALVPVLTGSVLTMYFADLRLQRLMKD